GRRSDGARATLAPLLLSFSRRARAILRPSLRARRAGKREPRPEAYSVPQTDSRKPNLANVKAAGHDMLRTVNRRILLSIVSDRQPLSRAEIAKISGLNKATVSTITAELLRDRCIVEDDATGRTTPVGGKPPTPLR